MIRAPLLVLVAVLAFASSARASVDYVLSGSPYAATTDFTAPCSGGPCANFPAGSRLSGRLALPDRLPPNMPGTDIYPLVTSFTFSDGINTYASSDPAVRVVVMVVATDSNGNLSGVSLGIARWLTGSSPHAVGDRTSGFGVGVNFGAVTHNDTCASIGVSPTSGVADACLLVSASDSFSTGQGPVAWSIAAPGVPVPTLAHAALALLALLVAMIGLRQATFGRRVAGASRH